jgi:hypothetical protein
MIALRSDCLASAAAALLALGLAGCGPGGGNPLIGKWRAATADCQAIPEIEFTPTTKIMHFAAVGPMPARENSERVVYQMSDKAVATLPPGGAGQMVIWELPDRDTLLYPGGCRYVREP